jgi:ribosomal-protein-alanine N-acetyltransferase
MSVIDCACLPEQFTALAGERTILRLFQPADITADYLSWLKDPFVTQFSNQRFFSHTPESCAQYLASFVGTGNLFLNIERKADGVCVGTMTAYHFPQHRTVDVGIMIGRRTEWGRGLGQDAWNTLLAWLLGRYCVRKVTAGTMRCNLPMVRLMERSGMSLEAVRPQQELLDGVPQDLLYFGKFSGH